MLRYLLAAALALPLLAVDAARAEEGGDALTRQDVERILRQYLEDHPEVVVEALRAWQQREQARQAADTRQRVAARAPELYDDAETPFAGNPRGDVVIVEFFDYRCGYCRRNAPDLFALIESDPGVKVVFKEFPILGAASRLAARAALAAREQGLYVAFHRALMTADIDFREDDILAVARAAGLDVERLRAGMESADIDAYLARTTSLARDLGIEGTPAFVIGGELYPGALGADDLERLVADQRSP